MNEPDGRKTSARVSLAALLTAGILLGVVVGCAGAPESVEAAPAITGDWLGQSPPGDQAELFAPGIVSTGWYTRDLTVTPDGDEGIYRARYVDGAYTEPERLGPEVNAGRARFNAWVAADESFLILPIAGIEGALGAVDYYVSFRNEDDTWSGPVNLGDRVNSEFRPEYAASLSPDGRWLFFMGTRGRYADSRMDPPLDRRALERIHSESENGNPDIYWIDAGFIQELRP